MKLVIFDDNIDGKSGDILDEMLIDIASQKIENYLFKYIGSISEETFHKEIASGKIEAISLNFLNKMEEKKEYKVTKINITAIPKYQ